MGERGGKDVQHKKLEKKKIRIWITIIRHGGLGHWVQESWPSVIYQRRLPRLTN